MPSRYEEQILTYVQTNQPVQRKNIVKHFEHLSPKTVYAHINNLAHKKSLYIDENSLITCSKVQPNWPIHPALLQFQNYNALSNMYANKDERLKDMITSLVSQYGNELSVLLCDLSIIAAVATHGFSMSDAYKKSQLNTEEEVEEIHNRLLKILNQ